MDRASKRRQVKPLAASLLDVLDYDSSDDSDFEVGDADATGSEGTGNGSDDEGSKDSVRGADSDSDPAVTPDEEAVDDEEKELKEDVQEEEKVKDQPSSEESGKKEPVSKNRKKAEKTSDSEPNGSSAVEESPKKWNLRRNRPMLDFTTMEQLNEMDDYDSEDDNDWRPTSGKKKNKAGGKEKEGSEDEGEEEGSAEEEDDGDDDENDDDDNNDEEDEDDDDESSSSSDSEVAVKKARKKASKNTRAFDEEETNDSHSTSQGKGNEDSLVERAQVWTSQRMEHILICCVCLGDNSEDTDEIIQCDNCGVTVHEGCYGVDGESDSIMSSASENSTEPWFCDACKNGVMPSCELCPSQDGIFKETDAGRWVHVVCALYVPGVAFGDIDKLRPVTLTEMNYTKYGAKECSLCEDARFARTGVCISCDAGMCRSYFHVTCAQREGLLSEAAAEEDIADPFFAYCKQHADRFDRKWKRKNYLALQSYCKVSLHEREKQLTPEAQARINTRLQQYRAKAEVSRNARPQAWVPREKLPRPLTSSASAVRKLLRKAELMGISTDVFATDTADASASLDGRRKHKQPALTADFVNYYLERNMRMIQIQDNILEQKNLKDKLESEQEKLHVEYNKLCESLEDLQNVNGLLRNEGQSMWSMLGNILGQKLNSPAVLKPPKERKPSKKEGGSPGKSSSLPAVLYSCGICKKNQDQHLLLLCDTCKLHYHLGCLDPPLTRMPKKTKNSYWQCSECDQASSDEADIAMETLPDGTKRSRRQIKGPIKFIPQDMSPEPKKLQLRGTRTRGQKRKRVSICEEDKIEEPAPRERRQRQSVLQKKPKADDTRTECTTCKGPGDNENLVRCDECQLCYHFGCLDPPLKKSPKQTGYGWICEECDTSSSKEEEEAREAEEEDGVKEETPEQEEIPN
ncbi:PHD finger protein 14 isoform X1 [Tachysurus fulvidraco]|uniref:PHD finger protein 14 isoform X1 n=1 Tax=Tachysurus fulvidraco TaxID=1234273 RepID=UPI000F4D8488|nr:PHD finger protein 14 isoform X1 [Tachysurus fulvidraco]XP_047672050.1 PHD finger protein 14 isoform X1 [Tachysurus fulvidraco]